MKIQDIQRHLEDLKTQALVSLELDPALSPRLALAPSPDPEVGDWGFPVFALQGPMKAALEGVAGKERAGHIAQKVAQAIEGLIQEDALVSQVRVEGAYVNLTLDPTALAQIVLGQALEQQGAFGSGFVEQPERVMIEFSAPNTNKPQHLGHVRNNLIGQSVANTLAAAGHEVIPVNLINDRGIHICKSMLAYKLTGEGKTPESEGIKPDHFVGKYYVDFNTMFMQEYAQWQTTPEAHEHLRLWREGKGSKRALKKLGEHPAEEDVARAFFSEYKNTYFNTESALGAQTKQMLLDWERGDADVRALWRTMNDWVFEGFDQTYAMMGIEFDHVYYESQTYKLGRDIVLDGVERGLFDRLENGAVAVPLKKIGLKGPDKILLRSDGTTMYTTQDLGTAMARFDGYDLDRMIYVVGDAQEHHFKQLFGILALLREDLKGTCTHLGYGMVDLPTGKMSSRTGQAIHADDLIAQNIELAREQILSRPNPPEDDVVDQRARALGLAGLKFFILDYNAKTRFVYDPAASIDPQGRSGVYLLYAYARIHSIVEGVGGWPSLSDEQRRAAIAALGTPQEMDVVRALQNWPRMMEVAARTLDPSKITEGLYELTRAFSSLYNDRAHIIKNIEGARRDGLLLLLQSVVFALQSGLRLLGIEPIERM